MSKKPAKNRSPRAAQLAGGLKRFSATLSDQAVIDAGVGIFIIVILSMLLLRGSQRPQVEPLPAGTTAAADIFAPEDLRIEDPLETERLRAQAAASILPVFDYNPKAAREVTGSIKRMFIIGREAEPDVRPEQLIAKIQEETGIVLDDEQLGALSKHRFNFELEKLMTDHLESVMSTGVVSSRNPLMKFGATGISR